MAMFADVTAEHVAQTMIEQCQRMSPDLVTYEGMNTGAGIAASVLGVPAAAYAIALTTAVYSVLHPLTVRYQGGELPDNVHVERFVAQSAVLPLVDLIVHHGGTGTVLGALERGLPQLLLPQGADQFLNAEILTTAGAVRALTNDAQQDGAIGEAVQLLLGDCPERRAARHLRDEIAAMPAPADVVPILVELASGR
jgi:UDP:flavonoid glycosyltransferase YjiC (YdhE family)